jgi:hydrogenase-4 component B
MLFINLFLGVVLFFILIIPFSGSRWKSYMAVIAVLFLSTISSIPAVYALMGNSTDVLVAGSRVFGDIPVRIDAFSGFFILMINFTLITGVLYGSCYVRAYKDQTANLSMHWICYILTHASLISVCAIQNSLAFLIAWEIMALASFILVIFEHYKQLTLKAGINYLIQSHVVILFLSIAFIWVYARQGSYDFNAIREFSLTEPTFASLALIICFFIGFAIKAGFVPFHTWLPLAHPAAPSHVSGVMSGVLIKAGIYGIIRMIFLVKTDLLIVGYCILIISVFSGVYGVMLAIVQHNLKRLLAYHSIENIGIIGIGIGLGCIGMGKGNQMLAYLGFTGAILHTLNHSLFKSLLFYSAGNIYQSTHTLDIDLLGGAGKQMKHTSLLFLIAALAICGLPPFNGFVSEFLIYSGLFQGLKGASLNFLTLLSFSIFGLALIGGLAMFCFTKAYGIVFLGVPRFKKHYPSKEFFSFRFIPMHLILILIISIGIFPGVFINILQQPVNELISPGGNQIALVNPELIGIIRNVGYASVIFILLTGVIYLIRLKITTSNKVSYGPTWGCGYISPNERQQYTASSFIRNYRKLVEPVLHIEQHKKPVEGIFPGKAWHETIPKDKAEEYLISRPLRNLRNLLGRATFLQNGRPQVYILYGAVFISLIIAIPPFLDLLIKLVQFLKSM